MCVTNGYGATPVDLGTAGNFAILAESGISTTAGSLIAGNIGVSPAAAGTITGPFGLVMSLDSTYSTSSLVTEKVYAANYKEPTPTELGVAVGNMVTAYGVAAGRTPDSTELHSGILSGQTLYPGTYFWSSTVLINDTLTLAGDSNAVWVFQIAQTLTLGSGAMIKLSGGAQPKNIFWQVTGQTTLGTYSDFKGIILDATAIVIMTGAAFNGRALAQTAVTLDAVAFTAPVTVDTTAQDTIPPTVTVIAPNGGEAWNIGSSRLIVWSQSDNVGVTESEVSYSIDNGANWDPIWTGLDTSYNWMVPNTPSTFALVKVTARDSAGNSSADTSDGVFTINDSIPPTVISTDPPNSTIDVSIYTKITATFSESMDSLTIDTLTFTVKQGLTTISGVVTYVDSVKTATFAPYDNLDTNAVYTATITTGATDLGGNALDSAYVWSFTTGMTTNRVPVDLGLAGNFVILSKTGISTTGVTLITGDIGVSPAAATYITGFGALPYGDPPNNTYATSPYVVGRVYSCDYAEPTPTMMTTAVSNMETAYTTAAGQTLPDFTELHSGNLTGKTLVRGLYKWGTGVLINAPGVTLTGDSNDVWIFQIAGTLTVGSGAIVTLSGGALPKNIFWQVADQTTLGTTVQFKGIILDQTAIVIQTGSTLSGRALAQSAVTLDADSVTIPTGVEQPIEGLLTYGKLQLMPCRPNPSSGLVTISYALPRSGNISLNIYDIRGRLVSTLAQGQKSAGSYNITWRGNDRQGRKVSSGVYIYRLNYEGTSLTRRLVLVR
jgi:hypothetical protein